jgi:hypothetical protein
MHAHNELAVLNRVQMFSMNDTAGPGDLNDSAMTVQVWFFLQLLAGKLVETWNMLSERFLQSNPPDVVLKKLEVDQIDSLNYLKDYFDGSSSKDNALRIIRDKTSGIPSFLTPAPRMGIWMLAIKTQAYLSPLLSNRRIQHSDPTPISQPNLNHTTGMNRQLATRSQHLTTLCFSPASDGVRSEC